MRLNVEELEKCYEMGWFSGGSMNVEITVDHNGNLGGKAGATIPIK